MGKRCVVLLDLFPAFATIDHQTFLLRHSSRFGIGGTVVLYWSGSRVTFFIIASTDWWHRIRFPQALLQCTPRVRPRLRPNSLYPLHFPLWDLLCQCRIAYPFYANDTSLYIAFNLPECQDAILNMKQCVVKVHGWKLSQTEWGQNRGSFLVEFQSLVYAANHYQHRVWAHVSMWGNEKHWSLLE